MTDNEIIKAMKCCIYYNFCSEGNGCPYHGVVDCIKVSTRDAIDLLKRYKAEIEKLQQNLKEAHIDIQEKQAEIKGLIAGLETLQKHITEKDAEIERLKEETEKEFNPVAITTVNRHKKHIENRAVKEFAERLKTEQSFYDGQETRIYLTEKDLDNLVKEMVGEG